MNAAEPRPWGVAATLAWGLLALLLAQVAASAALYLWLGTDALPRVTHFDGPVLAVTILTASPVQIVILAWAARRRGWPVVDYLGLTLFKRRDLGRGLVIVVVLGSAIALFGWLAGLDLVTPFQILLYASTPNLPWLAVVTAAVIVVAPFTEELMFRGFLFRGWVRPDGKPAIGILVISALWAIQHVQYDWFGVAQVFFVGIVLGWIRWWTGSTLLTFVLHALMNMESAVETVVATSWWP
jgi:membrane protease YdiL (CAAX protease family)